MQTNAQIFSIFYRLSPSLGPLPKKIVAISHTEQKQKKNYARVADGFKGMCAKNGFGSGLFQGHFRIQNLVHSPVAIPHTKSGAFNRIENPGSKEAKECYLPALAMICAMEEIALSLTSWSRSAALRRRRVEA